MSRSIICKTLCQKFGCYRDQVNTYADLKELMISYGSIPYSTSKQAAQPVCVTSKRWRWL